MYITSGRSVDVDTWYAKSESEVGCSVVGSGFLERRPSGDQHLRIVHHKSPTGCGYGSLITVPEYIKARGAGHFFNNLDSNPAVAMLCESVQWIM